MIRSVFLVLVAGLLSVFGSIGVAAAAPVFDPRLISVPVDELVPSVLLVALAVSALVGIGDRKGAERAWYCVGLGAGVVLVLPFVSWPAALPVGLAATPLGRPAVSWVRDKFGKADRPRLDEHPRLPPPKERP